MLSPNPTIVSRARAAASQALSQNRVWRAVRLLIQEAACRQALGDEKSALRTIRRALELGAPGFLVRSFVDEGPAIVALVREVADLERSAPSRTLPESYVAAIVGETRGDAIALSQPVAVIEPLSRKEHEILQMLCAGCSNAELAERLFVSQNTIKWHLQHVYAKLGIRNRTGAVAAARRLGLAS